MDIDMDIISIEEIIDLLKKKWKIIFLSIMITTFIAFIYTFYIIKPQYTVYTKVFVGKEGVAQQQQEDMDYTLNDVDMYRKLLKTYAEIIKTNKLVDKALRKNDMNLSSQQVLGGLYCTPTAETQLIEIKYTNSDKLLAADVIKAITDEFMLTAKELIPNGTVKVVEDVIIPASPSKPNKKLNICIGAMIGFIISIAFIFLQEFLDKTFKSKDKLERLIELPVLGVIPDETYSYYRKRKKGRSKKGKRRLASGFVLEEAANSSAAEAYRVLQTNIKYSCKNMQTILVTSSAERERKTTISGNLALAFSEDNIKVIIVDCNFRNPSIHKRFKLTNFAGLSEIIYDEMPLEKVILKYNDNLDILTVGNKCDNSVSMLSSEKMDDLLNELKEKYDLIILDSPPVSGVADAEILSTKVDGTLIVVKYGESKSDMVAECRNLLNMVGTNILGTILHGTEKSEKVIGTKPKAGTSLKFDKTISC